LLERASRWVSVPRERDAAQADARRFALVVGRALQLALLIEQAQWSAEQEGNGSVIVLARRSLQCRRQRSTRTPRVGAVLQGLQARSVNPKQVKVPEWLSWKSVSTRRSRPPNNPELVSSASTSNGDSILSVSRNRCRRS